MKKPNAKKKKILISAIAIVLVAAIGVGIWFGTKGSAEPVNVYPFDYVGMTEYWGDRQDTDGPVSTDKIQTVYLSETQTITEVLAKEGDEVKKGDVLMTFDTTLTELELERKRLEVEKLKLDLKDAQAQLRKIRNMKPTDPNAMYPIFPEPAEPDLGDVLLDRYKISEKQEYDGSEVQKALICWMKDGTPIDDTLLRAIHQKALEYQKANADQEDSSPAAEPEAEALAGNTDKSDGNSDGSDGKTEDGGNDNEGGNDGKTEDGNDGNTEGGNGGNTEGGDDGKTEGGNGGNTEDGGNGGNTDDGDDGNDTEGGDGNGGDGSGNGAIPGGEEATFEIPVIAKCYDDESFNAAVASHQIASITVGETEKTVGIATFGPVYDNGSVYEAKRFMDQDSSDSVVIPAYPQTDGDERTAWLNRWSGGITIGYVRSEPQTRIAELAIHCGDVTDKGKLTVEIGEKVDLTFQVQPAVADDAQIEWGIRSDAGGALTGTSGGNTFTVSGSPVQLGECQYTVVAAYKSKDAATGDEEIGFAVFTFTVETVENTAKTEDFYVILKVTEEDRERGNRLTWQGMRVLCYADGRFGFTLFDANVLEDHMLEPLEEEENAFELPEIDFGSGFTLAEIVKMRAEQEKRVKEQDLALKMAEADFKIMQAEVNDGKIYADFDGKVIGVLTEEEARQEKRPMMKVSAGGGFYVEVSVNELEKENLQIGQEVTVNDWNTGASYTGTVESIGDFPVSPNSWSSADNANVTYYPFTVFVDGSADLQAGNYVNVNYSTSDGENGIYLENPFLRTEGGRSYVFVGGEDGKLEKRYITVGKSLWGNYTQVLSGLSAEDHIAFPYGKSVKEGAPAVETDDLSSLYAF